MTPHSVEKKINKIKETVAACPAVPLVLLAAVGCMLFTTPEAQGADFSLKPQLSVSEEYTDNVFENSSSRRSDFITRAQPGLSFDYKAPLWDWSLGYNFDYRYYAKGSRSDDTTHNINAKGLIKLIDERLFLELNDTYKRVSLDVSRDTTNESLYQNQSDQNVATVSPYLVLRPTAATMLKVGYRYLNTWYKSPQAVSRQDHVGFLESSYEFTPRFFATAGYTFTREQQEAKGNDFSRHEVSFGPRYEYADKSFIFAQGGYIITRYDSRPEASNPFWSAGLTHTFDTLVATLDTSVKYSDDPLGVSTLNTSYSAKVTQNFKRGTLSLRGSYTEFSNTTADRLTKKRYSGGCSSSLELLPELRGTLGLTYEYYDDVVQQAITRKYSVDSGLSYPIAKETTLALTYRYIDYSSEKILIDNKQVNRVILEVKKVF